MRNNLYLLALLVFSLCDPVYADKNKEILILCGSHQTPVECEKAYKELPSLKALPSLPESSSSGPISIQVIPFSGFSTKGGSYALPKCRNNRCFRLRDPSVKTRAKSFRHRRLKTRAWDWTDLNED